MQFGGEEQSPIAWFCPSRWLLAHYDNQANIRTWSSHMCLADLNNEGENLLALVDFRRRPAEAAQQSSARWQAPYNCRLRVYRGQQLIHNHFLDDLPACLIASSLRAPPLGAGGSSDTRNKLNQAAQVSCERATALLTLPINNDVYFYHKLKASHRISLEDAPCIVETLNKSEFEAWQMAREERVDVDTLRELLDGLSLSEANAPLTSHSSNFLSLASREERKNYLLQWRSSRLHNGLGEHLMSMDTICCASARLNYSSSVTRSGDYGQSRDQATIHNFLVASNWNKIIDIQRDGLLLGTEDAHLLIYELRSSRAYLEANYRLPATPDHILVERRSPANLQQPAAGGRHHEWLASLSYKILVSCRNYRIYCIDQTYLVANRSAESVDGRRPLNQVRELLALNCNVIEMSWSGDYEDEAHLVMNEVPKGGTEAAHSEPNFIVACSDGRVYCFGSASGQRKWMVESDAPINCIISLPTPKVGGPASESSLIGVGLRANRIDFYVSLTGRIVDSIYLNNDDHCQAMTFGRFGREDNCLCIVTEFGHLLIFILKRTAKFANAQCLSSAASYASDALIKAALHQQSFASTQSSEHQSLSNAHFISEPAELPSAFSLTKLSTNTDAQDQALEALQLDHNCDQVMAKNTLDAHLVAPKLQIPAKRRDFVDQVVNQARHSTAMSRAFAKHMFKLRDKVKTNLEQQDLQSRSMSCDSSGNRITLVKITGLGNRYRVSLSLRLNLRSFVERHRAVSGAGLVVTTFLCAGKRLIEDDCQVKPFKFELPVELEILEKRQMIFERAFEFKLIRFVSASENESQPQRQLEENESVSVELQAILRPHGFGQINKAAEKLEESETRYRPIFTGSVNVPLN